MGTSSNPFGPAERRYQPVVRPTSNRYYTGRVPPMAASPVRQPNYKFHKTRRSFWPLAFGFLAGLIVCLALSMIAIKVLWPGGTGSKAGVVPTAEDPITGLLGSPSPGGRTTILLLGSDQRAGDPGYRTDVMILVLIDANQNKVSAVSFPRDLWVNPPDLYEMKINQVEGLGGFDATANMFQSNFGVRPDYYLMTNFDGFSGMIDRIGGVDVDVAETLIDDCDLPQAKDGDCTVDPGTMHMDGATALWYVRSRYTTSDLDRLRRAQEILYGVFKQMMNVQAYTQIPQLQAEFADNMETNLDAAKIISLLPVAARAFQDPSRISHYAITEDQATPSWSWDGMWILLPDAEAIHEVLSQAGFFTP